ncbi:MAG: hypothetical protein ACI976_001262 [Aureispira sp.]|jgi:hypothetical protein
MSDYTKILKAFWQQIYPLKAEEEAAFLAAWKPVHFKRK